MFASGMSICHHGRTANSHTLNTPRSPHDAGRCHVRSAEVVMVINPSDTTETLTECLTHLSGAPRTDGWYTKVDDLLDAILVRRDEPTNKAASTHA